ncbi:MULTISPECIES: hypothetical protein [unclassified Enterococcus]|uniref:hypothetical protein n=1 Tax=unclassified Enterococcus TaxID=2608891 RepID=UPI001553460D|nr:MULTISPECIES: hypothetical protein [unclassified Enterococcus]MBS7576790.1 hypothetical protein [Enterococcus sp. MMGLQ5-2]MBS7584197.1 hypothetical protein [Enterococcus sp. MMGLQ5-1]NPD12055.1 hypothetical protein [Enterococcus sp. MMGLQ5-1]NPD36627.1 hypothetical protein [Enterococcus sp. MMGLQ5-2]
MKKYLDAPLDKQRELFFSINTGINNSSYSRTCIIPDHWDLKKINIYLERSMNISKELISVERIQDVLIFHESIKNFEVNNKRMIDYYWYDVKEFIIEVQNQTQKFSFILVAGFDANEIDIAEVMKQFFPKNKIKVDYYRDSWLSKNINI